MAAVGSLTNPLHPEEFILFYSDADHQLASTQGFKSKPSSGDVKAINDPEVPTGPLLNPSSLAVVLLNHTVRCPLNLKTTHVFSLHCLNAYAHDDSPNLDLRLQCYQQHNQVG